MVDYVCVHICTLLILLALCSHVRGSSETVGNVFQTTSAKESGAHGIFLLEDFELDEGVVYRFSALCVRTNPVWFQVWRPVEANTKTYSLVGQRRLDPYVVPMVYNVSLYFPFIFTLFGDRVGIYNEDDTCPIGYQFVDDPLEQTNVYQFSVKNNSRIEPGIVVTFDTMPMPFKFSLSVSYDTDTSRYSTPDTGTVIPTTTMTLPDSDVPEEPSGEGTLQYKGNTLETRDFVRTDEARGIYIIPHAVLGHGVVVSFYAYFMRTDPIWFQIWRPTQTDDVTTQSDDVYVLVGQYRYTPTMTPLRHVVNLDFASYIFVEENDVLGFTNENEIGPVGYSILDDPLTIGPYSAKLVNDRLPYPGQKVKFNTMRMPYDYAIGVMYDTVADPDIYGTPPPWPLTTPTTTSTTRRSFTRPPDSTVQIIGIDNLRPTNKSVSNAQNQTYVIADATFPEKGKVTSFWVYFASPGVVQLQIWRHVISEEFQLIGRKWYAPDVLGEFVEVFFEQGYEVYVEPGDCIGFYNNEPASAIGYTFENVQLFSKRGGDDVSLGDVIEFDALPFPYKFSMGASYVPFETSSSPNTVSTRSTGTPALSTIYQTEPSTSPISKTTWPAEDTTPDSELNPQPLTSSDDSWLTSKTFILILFVWLILLTIFFIGLCCLFLYSRRKRGSRDEPGGVYGSSYNARTASRQSSANYGSRWMNDMKDDESIGYLNPQIVMGHSNGGTGTGIERMENSRNCRVMSGAGRESFYNDILDGDGGTPTVII